MKKKNNNSNFGVYSFMLKGDGDVVIVGEVPICGIPIGDVPDCTAEFAEVIRHAMQSAIEVYKKSLENNKE
jgi:hypothetical protein